MFQIGVKYWFKLKTINGIANIKGEVVEENGSLIRIKRDDGSFDIIPLVRIVDINEAKEEIKDGNTVRG